MNPTLKYFIRIVKSFVWFSLFFAVMVILLALFIPEYSQAGPAEALKNAFDFSGNGMFKEGSLWKIVVMFSAVSAIYPALSYVKRDTSISGDFENRRSVILGIFEELGYTVTAEDDDTLTFRKNSAFVRFMRMFEDDVILTKGDGMVTLNGPRKDLLRLCSLIQSACRR